jgi:cysteinyl-tRNA synthetase
LEPELAEYVNAQIEARKAAKKAKNYAEADRIRDELKEKGIMIEDTPQGVRIIRL